MLCEFAGGARGTFEASRTIVGPESQMAFDVYGTRGALGWNLEALNELRVYRATTDRGSGYTTVLGGDRFPHHGAFVPGAGNAIGFEDLVTIEDYEFCRADRRGPAVRARVSRRRWPGPRSRRRCCARRTAEAGRPSAPSMPAGRRRDRRGPCAGAGRAAAGGDHRSRAYRSPARRPAQPPDPGRRGGRGVRRLSGGRQGSGTRARCARRGQRRRAAGRRRRCRGHLLER